MTRYEQGFMNKCAEYGLDVGTSFELMKEAQEASPGRTKRNIGRGLMAASLLLPALFMGRGKLIGRKLMSMNITDPAMEKLVNKGFRNLQLTQLSGLAAPVGLTAGGITYASGARDRKRALAAQG